MQQPLTIAVIGCGARGLTYAGLVARQPQHFRIVAGADPVAGRVERLRSVAAQSDFQAFATDTELLAAGRLADVAIIATQDSGHFAACQQALALGYDVLLEKPIAPHLDQVLALAEAADRHRRCVLVCHVLRYTPFYRKAKAILDSGALGQLISIQANEGVMPWHQAHSFVRGHWSVKDRSSPMILAKCCHDMDIVHWLVGRNCLKLASFGRLTWFRPENLPAGAPARCTDGCPVAGDCAFNALRYAGDLRFPWLPQVYDRAETASEGEIIEWLRTSPWGRCVYQCDNDAVDHQVVAMEFAGGVTGTFTMTAFERGRHLEVYGTRGVLRGGEAMKRNTGGDLWLEPHEGPATRFDLAAEEGGYEGHGGGDAGLISALHHELTKPDGAALRTGLSDSVHSHVMAFAAEAARVTGQVVDVAEFARQFEPRAMAQAPAPQSQPGEACQPMN